MSRHGAICTIIAKNYLANARCLMDSIAQFHPELARFVILVDQIDGLFDPKLERFTVVPSDSLDLPDSKWFHFKYTLLELNTAVKPHAIDYLFRKLNFDFVVYLDPDILVYADLGEVLASLEKYSLVITPHITAPMHDGKRPSELDILRSGVYNLGFLAMARTEETVAFLGWWKERLYDHCVVDLPRGLFLDQRWADLAPCFVSRLGVLRDPTYNVAYWNLFHREVSLADGVYLVNGSPLRFFHFSGFEPDSADRLSKHSNRFELAELPAVKRLTQQYRKLLYEYGYAECRKWPYAYGYFANGVPIPDLGRPLHLECPGITQTTSDPFSEEGYRAFVRTWNEPLEGTVNGQPRISRLAYRLYRTRHDLQAAMPNVLSGDYRRFVQWLTSSEAGDHDLPDVFLAPFRSDVAAAAETAALAPTACDGSDGGATTVGARINMTRLAIQIYDKRPDLQAFFPDPAGGDAAEYLVWLLSYGKRQYALSEVFLSTLRRQWLAQVDRLPNVWFRLRYRALLHAAIVSAAVSPLLARMSRVPLGLLFPARRRGDAPSGSSTRRIDSVPPPVVTRTEPRGFGLVAPPLEPLTTSSQIDSYPHRNVE
jgi:hypothetical protein